MNTVTRISVIILPRRNQQKTTNSANVFASSLYTKHSFENQHVGPKSLPVEVKDHSELPKELVISLSFFFFLSGIGNYASDFEGLETVYLRCHLNCIATEIIDSLRQFSSLPHQVLSSQHTVYLDFLYFKIQLYFLKILLWRVFSKSRQGIYLGGKNEESHLTHYTI